METIVRPEPLETTVIMTKKLYRNKKDALANVKKITRRGASTKNSFVGEDKFPIQDNSVIGEKVTVRYRRMVPYVHLGESVIFETRNCYVLRCDTTEPYTFIGWVENTQYILVGDSRFYDTGVLSATGQMNEFLLIATEDFYNSETQTNKIDPETGQPIPPEDITTGISGTIIKADQSNGDIVVIAEYITGEMIRFVLADECAVLLKNYVPEPTAPRVDKRAFINAMKDLLNNYEIYKSSITI